MCNLSSHGILNKCCLILVFRKILPTDCETNDYCAISSFGIDLAFQITTLMVVSVGYGAAARSLIASSIEDECFDTLLI